MFVFAFEEFFVFLCVWPWKSAGRTLEFIFMRKNLFCKSRLLLFLQFACGLNSSRIAKPMRKHQNGCENNDAIVSVFRALWTFSCVSLKCRTWQRTNSFYLTNFLSPMVFFFSFREGARTHVDVNYTWCDLSIILANAHRFEYFFRWQFHSTRRLRSVHFTFKSCFLHFISIILIWFDCLSIKQKSVLVFFHRKRNSHVKHRLLPVQSICCAKQKQKEKWNSFEFHFCCSFPFDKWWFIDVKCKVFSFIVRSCNRSLLQCALKMNEPKQNKKRLKEQRKRKYKTIQ